jgi:predicted phosphate transport protein (TIGR00153 family)
MFARLRLIPRDERFFDLFNRSASNTLEGAHVLYDLVTNFVEVERKARHLKDIEHTGDEITHEVFRALNRTFVTPIDREDISNLASSLDDVIDWIEEIGRRMFLYRVDQPTQMARQFAKVILEQTEQVARAVPLLEDRRQAETLDRAAQEIHRLENEADDLLAEAIATLYDGVTEVPQLIKAKRWDDLYQLFEDTTDKGEYVATVLSNIALKNA